MSKFAVPCFQGLLFLLVAFSAGAQASLEEQRLKIFQDIHAIYQPQAAALGAELEFKADLSQSLMVGEAARKGRLWSVKIAGGAFRSRRLTDDGFRLMVCHELGHLRGGPPLRPAPPEWEGEVDENGNLLLSSEGQADYYASFECMNLILAKASEADHDRVLKSLKVDSTVRQSCQKQHSESKNAKLCMRSSMAGLSFLTAVRDFPISFQTPSQEISEQTLVDIYPSRQCRLDTLVAGALKKTRPACWFRSSQMRIQ